jgi:hypothetical protein
VTWVWWLTVMSDVLQYLYQWFILKEKRSNFSFSLYFITIDQVLVSLLMLQNEEKFVEYFLKFGGIWRLLGKLKLYSKIDLIIKLFIIENRKSLALLVDSQLNFEWGNVKNKIISKRTQVAVGFKPISSDSRDFRIILSLQIIKHHEFVIYSLILTDHVSEIHYKNSF